MPAAAETGNPPESEIRPIAVTQYAQHAPGRGKPHFGTKWQMADGWERFYEEKWHNAYMVSGLVLQKQTIRSYSHLVLIIFRN